MTVHDISELINDDYDKFLEFNEKTGNEMIEELTYHAFKDSVQEYREEMYGAITDLKKEDNIDVYYDDMLKPSHDLREFYDNFVVNNSSNYKVIVDDVYSKDFDDISQFDGIDYGESMESIVVRWKDSSFFIEADFILDMIDDELSELRENDREYDYESGSTNFIPFDSERIFMRMVENVEESVQYHLKYVKDEVSKFKNSPDTQLLSKVAGELGLKYDDEKNKIIYNK